MKPSDIVITGMGTVSSIGHGRDAFTSAMLAGHSGLQCLLDPESRSPHAVARFQNKGGQQTIEEQFAFGAPISDFDGKQYVKPRKALKVMCREIQTAFAASSLAVTDADLDRWLPAESPSVDDKLACDRVGTVFGSEMLYGDPAELFDAFAACVGDDGTVDRSQFGDAAMRGITPLWMLKYLPNMPACHYGIAAAAHGPNNTLTLGDVSGLAALMEGCGYLHRGIADVMIVTACGSRLNTTRSVFTEDQPLAPRTEPLARSSRPHADDAEGIVRGEAAGSLILETRQSALRRGVNVDLEVVAHSARFVASAAFRSGMRTNDISVSAGRGSAQAIRLAIRDCLKAAKVDADQLGVVVAHGMGDPVLDAVEAEALNECVPQTPIVLPITNLGHTGAASGMMELITAIAIARHGQIPPTVHADGCSGHLNLSSQVRPLSSPWLLVVCHTSPGSAMAVLLHHSH